MKPIDLDLAPRGLWFWLMRARLWHLAGVLAALPLLVAGALALGAVGQERVAADDELDRLQRRVDRLTQRSTSAGAALTPQQAQAAQRAIRQLNLPWMALLDGLEAAVHPDVVLLDLQVEAAAQRLRGTAEARNPRAMLAFAARMKAQSVFADVALVSHQVNQADKNKPVRFEFVTGWKQETP